MNRAAVSSEGLAMSLTNSLPPGHPIARQARRKIDGASSRAELDALLADLLDASDDAGALEPDGLLDLDFDNL